MGHNTAFAPWENCLEEKKYEMNMRRMEVNHIRKDKKMGKEWEDSDYLG